MVDDDVYVIGNAVFQMEKTNAFLMMEIRKVECFIAMFNKNVAIQNKSGIAYQALLMRCSSCALVILDKSFINSRFVFLALLPPKT